MRYEVIIEVNIPETEVVPSEQEIKEWLQFQTSFSGSMSCKNPLVDYDLDAQTFMYKKI